MCLELGLSATISPFISLLMRKIYTTHPKLSLKLNRSIHEQFNKKTSSFHSLIQDAVGSRFIESFLYSCNWDILNQYLEKHLIPNIVNYSKHIYANYPIQALIKFKIDQEPQVGKKSKFYTIVLYRTQVL